MAVDAVLLAVPVAALTSVLARHGQTVLLLPAASGFAFWFAKLDAWSPETMLLIALVTVVVRELERGPRWSLVLACGLLMLGARADYAAALG